MINDKRFLNNRVMDRLVEQLGYLDYRDMLAANKYILQSKWDQSYRQAARAKALSLAFSRMTQLKREQIDKQAAQEAQAELDKSDLAPEARREALEETRT